jgi:DNA-binding NarL/FixJ family response regulator
MIGVMLVDDQALVRAGFRALLRAQSDIDVVGEAEDGAAAVTLARDTRPDVVLMDIRMPGRNGLDATRDIVADPRLAGVKVIVLTTFAEDAYVFDAIRNGASGFLVKDIEPVELVHAIRVVHRGDALLSPVVTRRLIEGQGAAPGQAGHRAAPCAHRARAGSRGARRGRAVQRRDRRAAGRQPGNGEDARQPGDDQTRGAGPRAGRRARLRERSGAARLG